MSCRFCFKNGRYGLQWFRGSQLYTCTFRNAQANGIRLCSSARQACIQADVEGTRAALSKPSCIGGCSQHGGYGVSCFEAPGAAHLDLDADWGRDMDNPASEHKKMLLTATCPAPGTSTRKSAEHPEHATPETGKIRKIQTPGVARTSRAGSRTRITSPEHQKNYEIESRTRQSAQQYRYSLTI